MADALSEPPLKIHMDCSLYNAPRYYDIAFGWDPAGEVRILEDLFARYAVGEVNRLLEPACGSGRLLRVFAERGYRVLGYDANPAMAAYAAERSDGGSHPGLEVRRAGMTDYDADREFDAAYNVINSLGYLTADTEIVEHFRGTAAALRPGGVYVVQASCAYRELPGEPGVWSSARDGVRVRTSWRVVEQDHDRRLSREHCRLEIDDNGRTLVIQERHELRLWLSDELHALAVAGGLGVCGVHDERGGLIDPETELTGELGNLYHVFCKRTGCAGKPLRR